MSAGIPIWVVDAFTEHAFGGNQAAVCVLERPADESWMQRVAAEMRHSETAFVYPRDTGWVLRWFTPTREVDLCGHATLATAHVLWESGRAAGKLNFETKSGVLSCTQFESGIAMRFPAATAHPMAPGAVPAGLWDALGIAPAPVLAAENGNLLIVLDDAHALRAITPDFDALLAVSDKHGYIVSAPAEQEAIHDIEVRYFVPAWGIDEDPATGSIQCTLAPYWMERLAINHLATYQCSARGARLGAKMDGDKVLVLGRAVTMLEGTLRAA